MTYRFESDLISAGIIAGDRASALRAAARPLVVTGYVSASYPELVCEREERYPTGLSTRSVPVALAHADARGDIIGDHIAVGVLAQPVSFKSMEDPSIGLPVRIVFILALSDELMHLRMLSALAGLIRDETLLDSLLALSAPEQIGAELNRSVATIERDASMRKEVKA